MLAVVTVTVTPLPADIQKETRTQTREIEITCCTEMQWKRRDNRFTGIVYCTSTRHEVTSPCIIIFVEETGRGGKLGINVVDG